MREKKERAEYPHENDKLRPTPYGPRNLREAGSKPASARKRRAIPDPVVNELMIRRIMAALESIE
jgi:hypothetical protein